MFFVVLKSRNPMIRCISDSESSSSEACSIFTSFDSSLTTAFGAPLGPMPLDLTSAGSRLNLSSGPPRGPRGGVGPWLTRLRCKSRSRSDRPGGPLRAEGPRGGERSLRQSSLRSRRGGERDRSCSVRLLVATLPKFHSTGLTVSRFVVALVVARGSAIIASVTAVRHGEVW